jgi:PAS domain S-box-containing protein
MDIKAAGAEELLAAIVESSDNVIVGLGLDGTVLSWNAAAERLYGYAASEMLGDTLDKMAPADDPFDIRHAIRQIAEGAAVVRADTVRRRKDGTQVKVSLNISPIHDRNGALVGAASITNDLTERDQLQQALRNSDLRFRALIEEASDVISLISRDGSIAYVSPALSVVSGFAPEEVTGARFLDFIHPEDLASATRTLQDLAAGRSAEFRAVWRCRHKNGSWRVLEVAGRDCTGVPGVGGVVVTARDVTDRRKADQARRDSEAMLRAITHAARDAIALVDPDARLAFWNDGATELYGYTEQEAIGQDFTLIIPPEDHAKARQDFDIVRRTGRSDFTSTPRELHALTKRGTIVPIEIAFTPVRIMDRWNMLLIVRNIAERKAAESEREAHAEAIRQGLVESIQALAATLEARDPYTAGHARRVADLSVAIGERLGYSDDRIRGLRLAAEIHDIGKIGVPAEILSKPGRLSEIELNLIKTHAQAGYDILKNVRFPWPIAEVIWQHHERLDGSGYPRGLRGDQIIAEARIVAVADVVESMMQHRPYREALGKEAALAEISRGRGTRFDAQVVDTCLELFRKQCYKFAA